MATGVSGGGGALGRTGGVPLVQRIPRGDASAPRRSTTGRLRRRLVCLSPAGPRLGRSGAAFSAFSARSGDQRQLRGGDGRGFGRLARAAAAQRAAWGRRLTVAVRRDRVAWP